MKTDEKKRASLNEALAENPPRGLGGKVAGLEERVEDLDARLSRIASESPPVRSTQPLIVVSPPRPRLPPALPHGLATPTEQFRPAFASDPDLRRTVEEERVRREWESEGQIRWAKGREEIDRELLQDVGRLKDEIVELRSEVRDGSYVSASIARAHGLDLPESLRRSLPPPDPKAPGGGKPAVPALRRATKGVELAAVLGFLTILLQVVLEVLKRTGAP